MNELEPQPSTSHEELPEVETSLPWTKKQEEETTVKKSADERIAENILREARINSIIVLDIEEKPQAVNPPEPIAEVVFTKIEQRWINFRTEKSNLRKTKGVYAVKRSKNDALVEQMFTQKNIKPAKRPCLPSKDKKNVQLKEKAVPKGKRKDLAEELREAYLDAIKRKDQRR